MRAPLSAPRHIALLAACAVLEVGALGNITAVIRPGRWLFAAALAMLLTAVLMGALRRATPRTAGPTLAALALGAVGVVLAYGGPGATPRLVLDGRTVSRLLDTTREAIAQANASFPPMDSSRQIEMLTVAGAVVVYLLVELVAIGLRAPAWSGAVVLALWLPATFLAVAAPLWAFVLAAAGYLAVLALSSGPAGEGRRGPQERAREISLAARYGAAVAVVTLLLAPVLTGVPGWGSVNLPILGGDVGGPVRIGADLDLRADLGQQSGQVILTYTSTDPNLGPLRVFTMTSFNGRSWDHPATPAESLTPIESGLLLAPSGSDTTSIPEALASPPDPAQEADPQAVTSAQVQVTIGRLQDSHLPITTAARNLEIDGRWSYDPQRDEVVGNQSTTSGMSYTMNSVVPAWTAAQLAAAPTGAGPAEDFAVPETSHAGDVRNLARQITRDATTPYGMAIALQDYFRDSRNFTYDASVPPAVSDDAVWDFLQDKKGYCVHFATSMTMMARMLGIPARIAVGFLPGQPSGTTYTVTGKQAHAWPELYFAGAGWVRFEPTPAIQTGTAPAWTLRTVAPAATASPSQAAADNHAPTTSAPSSAPVAEQNSTGTRRSGADARVWWFGGAGLALLGGVGAALVLRRRRPGADAGPEESWALLRRRLKPLGVSWLDSTTPRAVVDVVLNSIRDAGGELDVEAQSGLRELAAAVEDARYARDPHMASGAELTAWVDLVVASTVTAISSHPAHAGGPSALPTGP